MSKKLLLLVAALVVVLAFATACGGDTEPAATPTPAPTPEPTVEVDAPPADEPGDVVEEPADEEPAEVELEPIPRPDGLIYSFATDAFFQSAEVGDFGVIDYIFGGSAYIEQAGSPQWTVIEGPHGGQSIRLTGRQNHWDSMDIETSAFDWNPAANAYRVTVHGSVDGAATARINGADGPYTVYDSVVLSEAGPFTLTAMIDADAIAIMGNRERIRVQTYPEAVSFNVYEIYVTEYFARPEGAVWSLSSDAWTQALPAGMSGSGPAAGLILASPLLNSAGDPRYAVVEGPAGNGIRLDMRNEEWHALDFRTPDLFLDLENHSYTITVTGNIDGGGVARIGGADSPWAYFQLADTDGDGNFTLSLPVDYDQVVDAGSRRWFRIQTEGCMSDFSIYDIVVTRN